MAGRLRNAGAAGGAGAAAGLAIATLVLPQVTSIAAPTPLLSTLVTLLLAFAGAGVQRWTSWNTREGLFANAVRVPPQPVAKIGPADLGIYPGANLGAYRPRDEDGAIRAALRTNDSQLATPVVIVGERACGKSRSAYQAALQALPETEVFVPLNPDGLRSLVDSEPVSALGRNTVLLWLDGLDRLIAGLDPSSVQSLAGARDPTVQIIATIRADLWNGLLSGTGQDCETARALDDAATTLSLEANWVDLPVGPADAVAAQPAPRAAQAQRGSRAREVPLGSRPIWRDRWFRCAGAAVALVVIGGLVTGISTNGRSLVEPPAVADQIASMTQHLLRGGRHLVVSERVQLHATEDASWVVVTEDAANGSAFYGGAVGDPGFKPPQSDELRIYDVRKGWLRLMLDFRPSGRGRTARGWSTPAGAPAALDYNDDGTEEIIAGWEAPDAHGDTVPFVIDWQTSRYRLIPMTPGPPELGTIGFSSPVLKDRSDLYLHKITLRNAARRSRARTLAGYPIQAFALSQKPAVRLLTGYYAALPGGGPHDDSVLEVRANQIEHSTLTLNPCAPNDQACPAPRFEQDALVSPARTLNDGLLEAWNERGTRWSTKVSLARRPRRECLASASPPADWSSTSGCNAASIPK